MKKQSGKKLKKGKIPKNHNQTKIPSETKHPKAKRKQKQKQIKTKRHGMCGAENRGLKRRRAVTSPGRCPPPARGRTQGLASPPGTREPRLRVRGGHGGEILTEEPPSGQTSPAPLLGDTLPLAEGWMNSPCLRHTEHTARQFLTSSESHREPL